MTKCEEYNEWIPVNGWKDPPNPPEGFVREVKRQAFMGIVTHYRFVRGGDVK